MTVLHWATENTAILNMTSLAIAVFSLVIATLAAWYTRKSLALALAQAKRSPALILSVPDETDALIVPNAKWGQSLWNPGDGYFLDPDDKLKKVDLSAYLRLAIENIGTAAAHSILGIVTLDENLVRPLRYQGRMTRGALTAQVSREPDGEGNHPISIMVEMLPRGTKFIFEIPVQILRMGSSNLEYAITCEEGTQAPGKVKIVTNAYSSPRGGQDPIRGQE